jgi:hypothetical protein
MRYVVTVLLLVGAHFSLTAFAPAAAGKRWIGWPFDADSKPRLGSLGGLPKQGGALAALLAGVAGLGFLAAAVGLLFGVVVPADWWRALVMVALVASILLYALYFGPLALIPIALDVAILWGVLAQGWSMSGLRGS